MNTSNDTSKYSRGAPAEGKGEGVHFHSVLQKLQDTDAGRDKDLSVHLSFICLLHLANEHELRIDDTPQMDALFISQD